jgi:hypothetical protein
MFNRKIFLVSFMVALSCLSPVFSQSLEENFNDLLHYISIGRFDLAKDYAKVILQTSPQPVKMLELAENNAQGYAFLLRFDESAPDAELAELTSKILNIIEEGRLIRKADPKIIVEEIKRLRKGTSRAKFLAVKRLKNSGEYAIMYMLDAMAHEPDQDELANLIWALPQIGRSSIRPLVAALQTKDVAIKSEIIKALGKISYPQSLAYLKFVAEKESSTELRNLAENSIKMIDPAALNLNAAQLFYHLAENYYYHLESLAPDEESDFANLWFWDEQKQRLNRIEVDQNYFNELMAMRACEWALKADPAFAKAIGLWIASYFKAESAGIKMPDYFGANHPSASVYATTIGPEYLHQALARAVKDNNAYVALGLIKALTVTAGEKSLFYHIGIVQPLVQALSFDDKAVKYSAAIAIAAAGPKEKFRESKLVALNLAEALTQSSEQIAQESDSWNGRLADSYALTAAGVMLQLVETNNDVIDLSLVQQTLINAASDKRDQIKILAGRILARLTSPNAQRAIAQMALLETNTLEVRIAAFDSLASSAKFNANMLDDQTIDAIYSLISSNNTDSQLKSAAAAAFGALNLPSEKVKTLILEQAKT